VAKKHYSITYLLIYLGYLLTLLLTYILRLLTYLFTYLLTCLLTYLGCIFTVGQCMALQTTEFSSYGPTAWVCPLSVVFDKFIEHMQVKVENISVETVTIHYPVMACLVILAPFTSVLFLIITYMHKLINAQ